jgi:hypothetical protein
MYRRTAYPVTPTCFHRVALVAVALAAMAGCDSGDAKPAAGKPTADSSAAAGDTKPAKAPATSSRKTVATKSEVKGKKGMVSFTVALPEGLKDVSDSPVIKNFRKGKDEFSGYAFAIGVERLVRPLEAEVARFEVAMKDPKKKGKMLDKGELDGGGWYVAASFEEGGKRNVSLMSNVGSGDTLMMCRGDASGPEVADEAAAAEVLRATCASIVASMAD